MRAAILPLAVLAMAFVAMPALAQKVPTSATADVPLPGHYWFETAGGRVTDRDIAVSRRSDIVFRGEGSRTLDARGRVERPNVSIGADPRTVCAKAYRVQRVTNFDPSAVPWAGDVIVYPDGTPTSKTATAIAWDIAYTLVSEEADGKRRFVAYDCRKHQDPRRGWLAIHSSSPAANAPPR